VVTVIMAMWPSAVEVALHRDVGGDIGPQEGHAGVQHRDLEQLTSSGPLAFEQGGGDGLCGGEAGDLVDHRLLHEHGGAVAQIGLVGAEPRHRLDDMVIGRRIGQS
jgi:hypothetical protein